MVSKLADGGGRSNFEESWEALLTQKYRSSNDFSTSITKKALIVNELYEFDFLLVTVHCVY